jgi:Spy/CpxP family protein refolding chaperone
MPMQAIKDKRWPVAGAVLAVFVIGSLVGGLGMHLFDRRHMLMPPPPATAFDKAIGHIQLNADQQAQVKSIIENTRSQLRDVRRDSQPRVMAIRRNSREQIQRVLTPEQWHMLEEEMKQEGYRPSEYRQNR